MVKYLLSNKIKAYIDEKDKTNSTPLFYALRNGNFEIVKVKIIYL